MSVMQKNRALLLAKIETTVGTDPTPAADVNGILCETPEITLVQKNLQRKYTQSYMGIVPKFNVGDGLKLVVRTEFKGWGSVSVAPEIDPLLRACNMSKTAVVGGIQYAPNSNMDTGESVTLYFWQHNNLHKLSGCRGTHKVTNKAGEYSVIEFEMTGVYQSVVQSVLASAVVSVSYCSALPPRFLAAGLSVSAFVSAVTENFNWNLNNNVVARTDCNASTGIREYMITDRQPTGDCDPEAMSLSDFNPFNYWETSSRVAMGLTIGTATGNKIVCTFPKVGFTDCKYGERNQILTTNLSLDFTPSAGNDEIVYTFK